MRMPPRIVYVEVLGDERISHMIYEMMRLEWSYRGEVFDELWASE